MPGSVPVQVVVLEALHHDMDLHRRAAVVDILELVDVDVMAGSDVLDVAQRYQFPKPVANDGRHHVERVVGGSGCFCAFYFGMLVIASADLGLEELVELLIVGADEPLRPCWSYRTEANLDQVDVDHLGWSTGCWFHPEHGCVHSQ